LSDFLDRVRALISVGDVRISEHGYDELAEDGLTAREIIEGIQDAVVVEEYPNFAKGPSVLLLQKDRSGAPLHAVWGVPKGHDRPVVLVTAYRPESGAVGSNIHAETVTMKKRLKSKYVYEGQYVAEVEVALVEDDTGWSPYISVEDAYKLDDVRDALRRGDLSSAAKYGRIYELRPVAHQ
jgi:hypothetical protein